MTNRRKGPLHMVFVFFFLAYIPVLFYFSCYFPLLSHQCPWCKEPVFVCFFVLPNLSWTNTFGLHTQFNEMSPQWHAWTPQQYQTTINIYVCSQCLYFSHHALIKKFLSSTGPQAVFLVALLHGKAEFELHNHRLWCSPQWHFMYLYII